MLNQTQNSPSTSQTNTQSHTHAPTADTMMSEVLHTLKNIDLQHDAELQQLENSSTNDELKNDIRAKLVAKHREKREPYVELLTELRKHSTMPLS